MALKNYIPNALTCGNLLCGCLALVKVFEGNLILSACFVGVALVLDFFDGFTARLLKVSSPIGKDLDSLADMVTFGVVPAMVMFKLIIIAILKPVYDLAPATSGWTIYPPLTPESAHSYLPYAALIIAIFSCIRLAKFNNDTRQSESFIGMPTPANAMLICSLPLIMEFQPGFQGIVSAIYNPWFLCILSVIMSVLLVSEIPLFALKFKNFSWADNKVRFIFLALAVILFVSLRFIGIPVVILLYILLSIVNNIFLKKKV